MAWDIGKQKLDQFEDYNSIIKELTGSLDDIETKITLAKFLKTNIGLTFEMVSGIKLFPWQEVILKGLLYRDNSLIVAARGGGKSFLISVFSILYSIFYPESKICLISTNFRGSRRILEATESMVNHKKAALLKLCFPNALRKSNDMFRYTLENKSEIFALPLSNGDGLRGTRCGCAIIDEGLTVSKEIQENILRPFLTVKQNLREEMEVREVEDELIHQGIITEKDRISFPKNKYCVFSSASYQFQYLYELYESYLEQITQPPKEKNPPTYFVMRFGYEAIPEETLFDKTQINTAKLAGENSDFFKREYRALFSFSGDGYFNVKKMHEATVPLYQYPTVQLQGDKNCQYILAIDPSYSASKSSDYFAMSISMLAPQERKLILVHSYGKSGGELREHYEYLIYLLTHFNIVFTIIDASGSEFIHGFNESTLAKERNLNLKFLDVDFCSDAYLEEIAKAKTQYNLSNGKIVYGQNFTSGAIRILNENLQNYIDSKKVWFCSPLGANEAEVKKVEQFQLPFIFKNKNDTEMGLYDFIDEQDSKIIETKNQTALIIVKATPLGALQYDLPQNLRRESGPNRPRKDLYTCLLLAAWAARNYYEMIFTEVAPPNVSFEPIFIS